VQVQENVAMLSTWHRRQYCMAR